MAEAPQHSRSTAAHLLACMAQAGGEAIICPLEVYQVDGIGPLPQPLASGAVYLPYYCDADSTHNEDRLRLQLPDVHQVLQRAGGVVHIPAASRRWVTAVIWAQGLWAVGVKASWYVDLKLLWAVGC